MAQLGTIVQRLISEADMKIAAGIVTLLVLAGCGGGGGGDDGGSAYLVSGFDRRAAG